MTSPSRHDHAHPHAHPHVAGSTHAPLPPPSREGSVVLDIGADTGALIIHTGPEQDGQEIEVSPVGDDARRTHAAVRPRQLVGRTVYCVVITPLPAGDYTVWRDPDTVEGVVAVAGGSVSSYRWT
jgi:hypothetical protein